MLEKLFSSRTRVKLLKLFLSDGGIYYVREIVRSVDEKINSVRRELENLLSLGLIRELTPQETEQQIEGHDKKDSSEKKKFYTADKDFPLYDDLKSIFLKSRLLASKTIASEIQSLGQIKLLVLGGYFVDDSDAQTDLLIVGKVNKARLTRLVNKLSKDYGHEIRFTSFTTQEFNYRNKITDRFLFQVLEGKKIVIVDETDKIY